MKYKQKKVKKKLIIKTGVQTHGKNYNFNVSS